MLRVLIADDSATARQYLSYIINNQPDMQVVGQAVNGAEAVSMAARLKPNVILMDVTMPEMDGLDATAAIMRDHPTPIVVISGAIAGREAEFAFKAMRRGALTLLAKPVGMDEPTYEADVARMVQTVRTMAGVKVIHHRRYEPKKRVQPPSVPDVTPEIVAIATSTGGPAALAEMLPKFPADFPLPIVIVQHIAADFLPSLVKWLQSVTSLHVRIAEAGDAPLPGTVTFGVGNRHLVINRERRFVMPDIPRTQHMPSGDLLLESVAAVYGAHAIGVVLTGMGRDGAHGLQAMQSAGALTIAQNEATSAVYGMPKEAAANAHYILSLPNIGQFLLELTRK